MIRSNTNSPTVMEFTKFAKDEGITDEDFVSLAMKFEGDYLNKQSGIVFHCLLRNLKGEYANLLFSESMVSLKTIESGFSDSETAKAFIGAIEPKTVNVHYHEILKENFQVPKNFSCFEHGTFMIKEDINFTNQKMLSISERIENDYLNSFENSQGHFMGKLADGSYSEITFGKTLGKTREICFGYLDIEAGIELMNLCVPESVDLDFWYLIA